MFIDRHRPIGHLGRRGGRAVDALASRDVEDLAVVNLGHRTMIAASRAFDATEESLEPLQPRSKRHKVIRRRPE
jgi:hypothetical protein